MITPEQRQALVDSDYETSQATMELIEAKDQYKKSLDRLKVAQEVYQEKNQKRQDLLNKLLDGDANAN